jgi:hypothetical protein
MNLEKYILRILDATDPLSVPETTLCYEVGEVVKPEPTLTQVRKALAEMEARRLVVSAPLGKMMHWAITVHGRAFLAA